MKDKILIRLAGVIPLSFFLLKVQEYVPQGKWPELLWLCNMANWGLACALFLASARWVFAFTLLLIIGIGPWVLDLYMTNYFSVVSIGSHLLSPALGIFCLCSDQKFKKNTWVFSIIFFLILLLLSRWYTPIPLNINIAHKVYNGLETVFPSYPFYLILNIVGMCLALYFFEKVIIKIFNR